MTTFQNIESSKIKTNISRQNVFREKSQNFESPKRQNFKNCKTNLHIL